MAEVLEYLCADFNRSALNYLGIMDKKDTTIEEKKTAEQQPVKEQPVKEQPAKEEPVKEQDKKEKKKKVEELSKEIEALKASIEKEKESYLRLYAEFETFRRRTAEEKLALVASAASDTICGLLPVLDDCERAMTMLASSSDEAAKEGTALIYNKLMDYLKTRGLAVIDAKGKEFDTDYHEAVTRFPAPSADLQGKVVDVIQTGYTLNGKVIRFAKVVVGA